MSEIYNNTFFYIYYAVPYVSDVVQWKYETREITGNFLHKCEEHNSPVLKIHFSKNVKSLVAYEALENATQNLINADCFWVY